MDPLDPLPHHSYKMAEIFAFSPTDFCLASSKICWEPPCWIHANVILSPKSQGAQKKFCFNLSLPNKIDAFARKSWETQLSSLFTEIFRLVDGVHRVGWWRELTSKFGELKENIKQTNTIFQWPFRFVSRAEFEKVDLATILTENPEHMSVYLALEKGSYREYVFLRIHTSPPLIGDRPRCLWFDKRLPDSLHKEDILPWFLATISRLPSKKRPSNVTTWVDRLLRSEPQLAPPASGIDKPWIERPMVILVLGPTSKVGYRSLSHFERQDIKQIVRKDEILIIKGIERHPWRDGKTMDFERTFYLFALDSTVSVRRTTARQIA